MFFWLSSEHVWAGMLSDVRSGHTGMSSESCEAALSTAILTTLPCCYRCKYVLQMEILYLLPIQRHCCHHGQITLSSAVSVVCRLLLWSSAGNDRDQCPVSTAPHVLVSIVTSCGGWSYIQRRSLPPYYPSMFQINGCIDLKRLLVCVLCTMENTGMEFGGQVFI